MTNILEFNWKMLQREDRGVSETAFGLDPEIKQSFDRPQVSTKINRSVLNREYFERTSAQSVFTLRRTRKSAVALSKCPQKSSAERRTLQTVNERLIGDSAEAT